MFEGHLRDGEPVMANRVGYGLHSLVVSDSLLREDRKTGYQKKQHTSVNHNLLSLLDPHDRLSVQQVALHKCIHKKMMILNYVEQWSPTLFLEICLPAV